MSINNLLVRIGSIISMVLCSIFSIVAASPAMRDSSRMLRTSVDYSIDLDATTPTPVQVIATSETIRDLLARSTCDALLLPSGAYCMCGPKDCLTLTTGKADGNDTDNDDDHHNHDDGDNGKHQDDNHNHQEDDHESENEHGDETEGDSEHETETGEHEVNEGSEGEGREGGPEGGEGGGRKLKTSLYTLTASVSVHVPLSLYGNENSKSVHDALSANWKDSSATTKKEIETDIEAFDPSVTAQVRDGSIAAYPSTSSSSNELSRVAISAITIAACALIFCVATLCLFYCGCLACCCKRNNPSVVTKLDDYSEVPAKADASFAGSETVVVVLDTRKVEGTVFGNEPSAPPVPAHIIGKNIVLVGGI